MEMWLLRCRSFKCSHQIKKAQNSTVAQGMASVLLPAIRLCRYPGTTRSPTRSGRANGFRLRPSGSSPLVAVLKVSDTYGATSSDQTGNTWQIRGRGCFLSAIQPTMVLPGLRR
jgi:hypothetical protein